MTQSVTEKRGLLSGNKRLPVTGAASASLTESDTLHDDEPGMKTWSVSLRWAGRVWTVLR